MRFKSLLFLLLFPLFGYSQNFVLENETFILEFFTEGGQRLVVSKDDEEQYLVFRLGTGNQIEFEFPKQKINTWEQFTFSYYSRGGGIENEAVDLNNLYFIFNESKYVVYEILRARNNISEYGLKIIDEHSGLTKIDKARPETVKGTLGSLRDNEKISEGDELF